MSVGICNIVDCNTTNSKNQRCPFSLSKFNKKCLGHGKQLDQWIRYNGKLNETDEINKIIRNESKLYLKLSLNLIFEDFGP